MKKTTKKPSIINTFSVVKGEPLSNFGGIKPRFDSDLRFCVFSFYNLFSHWLKISLAI